MHNYTVFKRQISDEAVLSDFDECIIMFRKGLFRYQVFLYRAFILEQSSLDEMKGI